MLKELRRVTGWHTLFDHEGFFLLLAAISSTTVLWLYPGIGRIYNAYFPQTANTAAVVMTAPQPMVTSTFEVEMNPEPESEVWGQMPVVPI